MLTTEVPQSLYAQVMNANPSRHAGPTLPVDSVSWPETQEFCQRLGWMLGTTVRLPTEDEWRAALVAGEPAAWSAETSGGGSREVALSPANAGGFHDLLGNVAEWLQPRAPGPAQTAQVAGGSFLDATEALRARPIALFERSEHLRHVGFRVVVERPAEIAP
jgi:formylglycine-generating enzyme required for sulfatase activity